MEENIDNQPLAYLNIKYPIKYLNPQEGINNINVNNYGVIIKKNNKLYKISDDNILHKEEVNAYNYNKWYNILYVYMLQKENYNINEFISEFYLNDISLPSNIYITIDGIFNIMKSICMRRNF